MAVDSLLKVSITETTVQNGKQKHLGCKNVVWPRKTAVTKRSDMRVWPRLTMHLR